MGKTLNYGKYCPDPQFKRKNYEFLCGEWDFAFSTNTEEKPLFDRKITVPYSYECAASGIGDERIYECVWYERTFELKPHTGAVLLHFEAVDHQAFVYVNGVLAGEHKGGFTHFCIDITAYAKQGVNTLTVKVLDSLDKAQLRGKQRIKTESYDCWYVQTTGIWKPVWLEYAGSAYLKDCFITAKADGSVRAELVLSEPANVALYVYDGNRQAYSAELKKSGIKATLEFNIPEPKLWSGSEPNLYSVTIRVLGLSADEVETYFGIREITLKTDGVYINGIREFQQMILDQGYWKDTMLTAPDEAALEKDVMLIKKMGFNGVRKHQKLESKVFYHLCDKYGLYVWGEIPSAYVFDERMRNEYSRDCIDIVKQLKNHPSVICWLLFNESWGVSKIKTDKAEQEFIEKIAAMVKDIDGRPVITNDGWHHLDSDILSLHEYEQDSGVFKKEYADKEYVISKKILNQNTYGRAFSDGFRYKDQPVMISEYGGISLAGAEGWGYGASAENHNAYEDRLRKIVNAVTGLPYVSGCCYTQLTDVQQEANGLLGPERNPKLPLQVIFDIFSKRK